MLKKVSLLSSLAILLLTFVVRGQAALVGTSVTGSLTFSGDPSNYFDPLLGFVPATGYLNASGTTVMVSNSAVEFGFDDGASIISADFSGNQLTVNDTVEISGPNNSFQMNFMDSAFAGQYLSSISDNFPLSAHSLTGNLVALNYSGGNLSTGESLTAKFAVIPVPEPSMAGLAMLIILASCLFFARKRRIRFVQD